MGNRFVSAFRKRITRTMYAAVETKSRLDCEGCHSGRAILSAPGAALKN
jgi:hypothetical protein